MTNLTKNMFCKKHNLTEDQFYGKETVGGSLDLSSLTSIPDMGTKETAINTMLQNEYPQKLRATVHSCIYVMKSLTMALLMFIIGIAAKRCGIKNVIIGMVGLQIISMFNYIRIKYIR